MIFPCMELFLSDFSRFSIKVGTLHCKMRKRVSRLIAINQIKFKPAYSATESRILKLCMKKFDNKTSQSHRITKALIRLGGCAVTVQAGLCL